MPRIKKVRDPRGQGVLRTASKYQKAEYRKTRQANAAKRKGTFAKKFLG